MGPACSACATKELESEVVTVSSRLCDSDGSVQSEGECRGWLQQADDDFAGSCTFRPTRGTQHKDVQLLEAVDLKAAGLQKFRDSVGGRFEFKIQRKQRKLPPGAGCCLQPPPQATAAD